MGFPEKFIDRFLAEQHRKWLAKVHKDMTCERPKTARSDYETWVRKADQKRPKPDQGESHTANPGPGIKDP